MSTNKLADMTSFSLVYEGHVILTERGVYRQVHLYKRGEQLFAGIRNGFVRLLAQGSTTVANIHWTAIEGVHTDEDYLGPRIVPFSVKKKTKLKVA
jgi:hypothetical protein